VFLGNPASISPEQVLGLPASPRSDLYAFGVLLFTLLSGSLPFDGTTPLEMALNRLSQPVPELHTRISELPAACDEVISRLLEVDPARRYRCATEAIEALQCLLTKRSMPVAIISTPSVRTGRQPVERPGPQEGLPAPAIPTIPAIAAREAFDPFVWWSAQSIPSASSSSSGTAPERRSAGPPDARAHPQELLRGRRTLLRSLVAGAATTGVLVVSGCSLATLIQRGKRASAKRIIGTTRQAINSAQPFTNERDGQASLLLRLDNGRFVACERACSHAGFPVSYDPERGLLVCPAHGAVFDPLHGFRHVSGPGSGPLTSVSIKVRSDGTVITE
jgi:serine/threonine protein kinase